MHSIQQSIHPLHYQHSHSCLTTSNVSECNIGGEGEVGGHAERKRERERERTLSCLYVQDIWSPPCKCMYTDVQYKCDIHNSRTNTIQLCAVQRVGIVLHSVSYSFLWN